MLRYTSTPVQEIFDTTLDKAGVQLLVKREDLNHPYVSGNKWWKLKYNLEHVKLERHQTILTFGGAYSNHILATAAAANELGFKSIGVIRGEKLSSQNHVLAFAEEKGMLLHYISREDYRKKIDERFIEKLRDRFGDFFLIPEGGTNKFALEGCKDFGDTLLSYNFQHLILPIGTGGTAAGILSSLPAGKNLIGISVLKGGDFLENDIKTLLNENAPSALHPTWMINHSYHFGGYAKSTPDLLSFIETFKNKYRIPIEHVYTGKMFAAIFDLIRKGNFSRGDSILAIHTGGVSLLS